MEQEGKNCEKIISIASSAARVVIHYQQAYDILDEMVRFADTPSRALDSVYKLSRLVFKTFRDIQDDKRIVDKNLKGEALERLKNWAENLEKALYLCFNTEDRARWIKEFASLSISPDYLVIKIIGGGT
ncbi:hypothetical protein [Saccharolobus shibatae]|uniref:Uncharacterized protein n=1 Tax=Saccharolobus shibatae TaxID=2286 RepID=A0A8F5BVB3_9CREN|nr:hypothetical protein [Saccharolobus shibatae]QXJ32137.1 hypothetical protein J5U21_01788 [Saccharolobus shibatae]